LGRSHLKQSTAEFRGHCWFSHFARGSSFLNVISLEKGTGMQALERQHQYISFLQRLKSTAERILLLDYDGTLAPFSVNRDHAFPYPEVPALISRIMAQGTRVVLVTGRPARELVPLSGIHPHPEIWGSHGMERLQADGSYDAAILPPDAQSGLLIATQLLEEESLQRRMELKPGGVAVHWRDEPAEEVVSIRDRVLHRLTPLLSEYPLRLLEFDGGLELRISGWNKGSAVTTVLNEAGEDAAVAYLGDDITDEDAFRALKGRGLSVLVRREHRGTDADIWLQPPEDLIGFFQEWLRETGGGL
jgi:trehalose 6-phosphate phosphatase